MKKERKKFAALFMSFLMLITMTTAWLTPGASALPAGDGVISTPADLEKIRENPAGDFVLANDLELTEPFVPIETFSGTLDGQGHTIRNLTIEGSLTIQKAAFFVENAGTVKNLGFSNVNITGISSNSNCWTGGIAATNRGTIDSCFVTGAIQGGYRTGGIAVHNYGTVRNCYTVITAQAKVECGAVVSVMEDGSVLDSCYAVPNVTSEGSNTGGIAAYGRTGATIQNSALLGGTVNNSEENIARIVGRLNTSPVFVNNVASENALINGAKVAGEATADNKEGLTVTDAQLKTQELYQETLGWDFDTVWKLDTALGRPTLKNAPEFSDEPSVVEISSPEDLDKIRINPAGEYRLTADLTLSGNFTPIPYFSGTFDGQGHTISGLRIIAGSGQDKVALFAENTGTIQNLGLSNVTIVGIDTQDTCWAAGIAADNKGTIAQCYVNGVITGGYRTAGIAAHSSGTIQNCYTNIQASAKGECAGIVAVAQRGSVTENCYTVPNLFTDTYNTGGIAAYGYDTTIVRNNAVLAGSMENTDNRNIARILGRLNGTPTFENNVASENVLVQGEKVTEGAAADNNQGLTVTDEELKTQTLYQDTLGWDFDSVWAMDAELGRPVLKNVPEISWIPEDGTIATAADLEKIRNNPAGDYTLTADIQLDGTFTPLESFTGTLEGNGHTIKGLSLREDETNQVAFLMENKGTIRNLGFSNVKLQGTTSDQNCFLAGIAVKNYGTIEQCYVNGKIYGGHRAGGITVHNYGTIRNCYTQVKINANWECGAIAAVAEDGSLIDSCYAIPNVYSYVQNTGGIASYGRTGSTIQNSAVLSGSIENAENTAIARIEGRLNGSPVFANNVASEQALVNDAQVEDGAADNNQGLTVTEEELKTQALYQDTLGWDFDTVWEMDAASSRPVLQAVAEDPMVDTVEIRNLTLNVGADETKRNLNWLSTSLADGLVQVVPADQYQEGQGFPTENVQEFKAEKTDIGMDEYSNKAEISGLKADTEYVYRVGNEEKWSEIYSFTTGAMDGDFNFLFAGDPQIGSSGNAGNDAVNWDKTLDYATQWFPQSSFVLSAGDQVEHHSSDIEYEDFLSASALTSLPLAANIGNHDVGSLFYDNRFNMPNVSEDYGTADNESNSGGDYWFIYNDVLFLSLNSNNLSTASHQAFLDSVLREHGQGVTWKVVTFHHSIYSAATHNSDSDILQRREELPRLFSQYDIDVVLMGHDHAYTRSKMMNGTNVAADQDLTDPASGDVLYLTANSASGSKYYALQNGGNFLYSEVSRQDSRPSISNIEVTDNTFTISTYFTDTDDQALMDTVTLTKNQTGDKEAPTILLPVEDIVAQGSEFDPMAGVDVIDNQDDGLEASMQVEGSVDTSTQGVYTLTYTVSDKAGNQTTAVRTVTVSVSEIIQEVQSDTTSEVADGVELRKMTFEDTDGSRQVANVIDVDLANSNAEIIVGTQNDAIPQADENGMMVSGSIVNAGVSSQAATTEKTGKDVVAGVNGEFFTANGPEGYLIKDGCPVINGVMVPGVNGKNYPLRAFFGVRKDGSVLIGNYGEDWEREKDNLVQASGGQFWMVKDGVVQDFSDQIVTDPNDPNYDEEAVYRYGTHPRTAVGIREDGSVFFVVVDGRGSDGAEGFTIEKLGQYMKDLGAYQALNMDGGGSSTAVTLNRETGTYEVQNTPSDATGERQVLSSLLVLVPEPTLKLNLTDGALQGVTAHNFEDGSVAVIARYNEDGTKLLDKRMLTINGAGENEEGKYFTLSEPMAYEQGDQFRLYAWNSLSEMTSSMAPQVAAFQSGDGAVSGDLALNQVAYEESEHTFPLEAVMGDTYFLQEQSGYTASPEDDADREISLSYEYDKADKTVSGTVSLTNPVSGIQVTLLAVKKDAELSNLKESDIYYLSEVPTDENGQVKYSFALETIPEDYKLVISAPTAEQKIYSLTEAPIADKTALNEEIAAAQALRQEDYTADSWKPFAQALADALKVQEDPNATQTQIDSALDALKTARESLEKVPDAGGSDDVDKTALEKLVAEALKLQEADYTPESWKSFAEALSSAQAVLNAEDATQRQIDDALAALSQAQKNLIRKDAASSENPSSENTDSGPQTGDQSLLVWILLAGASLLMMAGAASVRVLQRRQNR